MIRLEAFDLIIVLTEIWFEPDFSVTCSFQSSSNMATNKDDPVSKKEKEEGSSSGLETIKLWQVSVTLWCNCMANG